MKKNTNILVTIMAVIGAICAAAVAIYVFKDQIRSSALFQKFFGEDDDLDFDCFDDEFFEDDEKDASEEIEEQITEETAKEEDEEEEKPAPKARRGYIPLKFPANEIA